jgi:hypothetical protein
MSYIKFAREVHMIPKIIHYCWFGSGPLPLISQKCITSWKRYFPEYEIREWNESNYNVHKIPYIDEAYRAEKYAFVSDYARFDILYNHGGIYFDTDVEVIKPFDDILSSGGFMGFESTGKVIAAGLGIGCNAGLGILYQILEFYSTLHFINPDGTYNLHTVVEYVTNILKTYGLKNENIIQELDGLNIYPSEYFSPLSAITGKLTITKNTHSIHHYTATWIPDKEKYFYVLKKRFCRVFGRNLGTLFSCPLFLFMNISNYGVKMGVKKILMKLMDK